MEMIENYKIKTFNQSKSIIYAPYKPLIDCDKKINDILNDINNGNYIDAMNKTHLLINSTLEGIKYIYTYDRLYLKIIIASGYISTYFFLIVKEKEQIYFRELLL